MTLRENRVAIPSFVNATHSRPGPISWTSILIILATVLATCGGVFCSDYGYSDDFSTFPPGPVTSSVMVDTLHYFIGEGRPLFTVWVLAVFHQAQNISDLRYVRLVTLFALFFSGIVAYRLVFKFLFPDRFTASLMGAIFAINPAFLIMSGWACIGCDAYASLMGFLASYILLQDDYFDKPLTAPISPAQLFQDRPGWLRLIVAAALLVTALALYQPGAMVYWTGATIWIIGRFEATLRSWLRLGVIFALFAVGVGLYFLTARLIAGPESRLHVSISIFRRLGWFVLSPLQSALSYPSPQTCMPWSIAALLLLSAGLWLYCRQMNRTMLIPPLVLALTPLTVLPNVFAANHYDASRCRGALYGVLIILWCVSFAALVRFLQRQNLKLVYILTPAVVILTMWGQYHLQRYLITPQIREQSALLVKLQEYVRDNPQLDRTIVIYPPPKTTLLANYIVGDELGMASSSQPWAVGPLVRLILADVTHRSYQDVQSVNVTMIPGDQAAPENAFTIDLRQLHAP